MANVTIDIASEFRGKPAFDKAGKSVSALEKSVNKLGKQIASVFAISKVVSFGKASVKAFAEDEAATIRLTNAVQNLGYAFATPEITQFIKNLELTSGIADDVLRPAFQALLTTTKDVNSSYKLLNDSIAISRGSGVELATVAQDLANGYVGITRGLKKYNTGLTQSELKTKSFSDILDILNKQFAGANAAYLETYAYKMDVLTVATNNAKESIGKGLFDALARIGGGNTSADAVKAIDNIAKAINGVVTAVSVAVEGSVKLYKAIDYITTLGGLIGGNGKKPSSKSNILAKSVIDTSKIQIKTSKTLAKSTTANTKAIKEQAALAKQSALFDLQQIELVAALKGKLSDEDRKRAELQLAILQGNEDEAKRLSTEIANSIDKTGNLAKYLQTLPDANNPFKNWAAYLDAIEAQAARIARMGGGGTGGATTAPSTNVSIFPDPSASQAEANRERGNLYGTGNVGSQNIVVQIDGKTIASALLDQSLSGNQAYVDRRTGGFNW